MLATPATLREGRGEELLLEKLPPRIRFPTK